MFTKEEKKKLVVEFWGSFQQHCRENKLYLSRKRAWLLNKSGVNNVHLKFDVDRVRAMVVLELLHKNEERRLEVYELIERYKLVLEEGFENGLNWDLSYVRDNGQEVCRIYVELREVDLFRKEDWPKMFDFMAQNMRRLETNFLELRDLIRK